MYVIDTNSLRVCGNYYPESFPTFWTDLDALVAEGRLTSVSEVLQEFERQNTHEHLTDWVARHGELFNTPSAEEMQQVREILAVPHFQQLIGRRQLLEGQPVADPFIVARAKVLGACVVTEEVHKPNGAKIPNVCEHFGVDFTNVAGMLRREGRRY